MSIWKSKKGGIPVISEIVAAVKGLIDWFLHSAPRPLQLLIFLVFILWIFSLVGTFLNVTGFYCDTAGNEYKTSTLSLLINFELQAKMPDEKYLNGTQIPADEKILGVFPKCVKEYHDPYYYNDTGFSSPKVNVSTGTGKYYDGSYCTECEAHTIYDDITGDKSKRCIGDVYRHSERSDFGYVKRNVCGKTGVISACEPPIGYYYDFETSDYLCLDDSCAGKSLGTRWNELLLEKGAKLIPPSEYGEKDYRNAVRIECDVGELEPKLRFFGVEVFDYRIWVFLLLLSALLWGVWKVKHP